jgi:hypothetical protein
MHSQYQDFTFDSYRQYITTAKEQYQFCFYDQCPRESEFILWRHDVDISLHRATKLAQIEHEEGVYATYFIWPHSRYYHFWEREIAELIYIILNQGHRLGLHFDCEYYSELSDNNIGNFVADEAEFLRKALHTEINFISFHNPTKDIILSNQSEKIGGLINSYSDFFIRQCKYISDSNGIWKGTHLEEVLTNKKYPRLQILTHPVWWTDKPAPPIERVIQCIEGRSQRNRSYYEERRRRVDQ